jgi:ketopantoate reductase
MLGIDSPKERGKNSSQTRQHSPIKNSKLKTQNSKLKMIGVIGIGGRTGTMFAFELKNSGKVFGIGRNEEIELIKEKKLFVKRGENEFLFEEETIGDFEFPKGISFNFLFLTVKNPIGQAVSYYYRKIKERNLKPPTLFLSQNGIEAPKEAILALKEIFGKEAEKIPVFRVSLFNPVDKKILNNKTYIIYSLPIRFAISKVSGEDREEKILEIFKGNKDFEFFFLPKSQMDNMQYSKLFLNLIGMASATHGLSISEGFSRKEIFKEEIGALREYKKIIFLKGGKFLNFPHYPVKFLSFLISLPISFLFPFRNFLAKLIEKGRIGKSKDLDEIDYYNGGVVKLAKELGIEAPINSKILERAKRLASLKPR